MNFVPTSEDIYALEHQLQSDRHVPYADLCARDAAIAPRVVQSDQGNPASHGAREKVVVLFRWLTEVRGDASVNERSFIRTLLKRARATLAVLGALVGVLTAFGTLKFRGDLPVGIIEIIGLFIGVQMLLLLSLGVLAVGRRLGGLSWLGGGFQDLARLVLVGWESLSVRFLPARPAASRPLFAQFPRLLHTAARIERVSLLALTQVFAVTFNLGLIATCFVVFLVSDVAFGWGTTVDFSPDSIARFVRVMAAPWSWLGFSNLVPDEVVVRMTQYDRLHRTWLAGEGLAVGERARFAASWWPFLMMSLLFYGLLPRLSLLLFCRWQVFRILRGFDGMESSCQEVLERLATSQYKSVGISLPSESLGSDSQVNLAALPQGKFGVVLWRDVAFENDDLIATLAKRGWDVGGSARAGGDHLDLDGALAAQTLRVGSDRVLVVADSWEAPGKALLRFLRGLRTQLGKDWAIGVVLAGTTQRQDPAITSELWRQALASLKDSRLGFFEEPL